MYVPYLFKAGSMKTCVPYEEPRVFAGFFLFIFQEPFHNHNKKELRIFLFFPHF